MIKVVEQDDELRGNKSDKDMEDEALQKNVDLLVPLLSSCISSSRVHMCLPKAQDNQIF